MGSSRALWVLVDVPYQGEDRGCAYRDYACCNS